MTNYTLSFFTLYLTEGWMENVDIFYHFFDRINRINRFFFVCDKILPKAKNPVNLSKNIYLSKETFQII